MIPEELQLQNNWLIWHLEFRDNRQTKVPYQGKRPDEKAESNNPETWCNFKTVNMISHKNKTGVGYVFDGTGIYGIDLDGAFNVDGSIYPQFLPIITDLRSYQEISPSGVGLHIIFRCNEEPYPSGKSKQWVDGIKREVGLFGRGKYFTFTDTQYNGITTVENIPVEKIRELLDPFLAEKKPTIVPVAKSTSLTDDEIISLCRNAKNNNKFHELFDKGYTTGYPSASEADMGLASILAFYTQDDTQIRRIMERGALSREKYQRTGYLDKTAVKAVALSSETYKSPRFDKVVFLPDGSPKKEDITKKKIFAAHSTGEFTKVQQALDAIVSIYNKPFPRMFVRGGNLCRVIYDENGVPRIDKLEERSLSVILTQCIDWYNIIEVAIEKDGIKSKEKKEIEVITVTPPLLVARLYALGQWEGIPALSGIVESPYITDDGAIVSTPGYNPKTKLYLTQHQTFKGVTVPEQPNEQEIIAAKELLFELFSEFTFEDEASRQNNVACLITAAIRPTIKGLVPAIVYDKPVMGSGASLLAELITGITTGRPASMTQAPDKNTEGEWNKLILGLLREGRLFNVFDNVEGDIYSAAFAALLTAQIYRGRVLGKNATEEYPNNSLWVVNGNNIQITHDLPRRCVWVRLATDVARPYERTDWKIQNIREYVIEHQSEYLSAILTIVRGWHLAGKPGPLKNLQVMGSYEKWRDMLGGIMNFIGCTQFLVNTSANLDISEEAHEDIEEFLEEIFYAFPQIKKEIIDGKQFTRTFTLKEITPIDDPINYTPGTSGVRIDKMPGYLQEIQREHPKKLSHAIGNQFRKMIGRVFPTGYKLIRGEPSGKVSTYKISFKNPIKEVYNGK